MATDHPGSGVGISGSVDIATAAKSTNTSQKFIRQRIASGDLPAYRIKGSKLIRINIEDLESLKEPVATKDSPGLTAEQRLQIKRAVDSWPKLSPEQRDAIAALFAEPERGDLSA